MGASSEGRDREPDKKKGKEMMRAVIASVSTTGLPAALTEIRCFGRTLEQRPRRVRVVRSPRHQQRDQRGLQQGSRALSRIRPRHPKPQLLRSGNLIGMDTPERNADQGLPPDGLRAATTSIPEESTKGPSSHLDAIAHSSTPPVQDVSCAHERQRFAAATAQNSSDSFHPPSSCMQSDLG